MSSRFDELKNENISVTMQIESAAVVGDHDKAIELKKVLYSNKLEMLNLLTAENRRAGLTASALRTKVDNMPHVPRYATGIEALDQRTSLDGGIEVGSLVLLGGASGSGKSHLTLEIVCNVSAYSKAVFFNLEMGERRIVKRLNEQLTTDKQWDNLIIDSYSRTLDDIMMEIELHARDGARFFVIDSRMKIDVLGEKQEYQKISMTTKALSSLCQRLDIIIFLINQISEDDLKNNRLAFKGSGDQLYDADIALFYAVDKEDKMKRNLICSKNRQDDRGFVVDLELNNGKTVEVGSHIPVQTTEYNHSEMGVF
jgi:replicative DNA helicase